MITTITNTTVWSWAYGEPNGNSSPVSTGLTYNLRFPGQYADQESGLYYNMNRYYNPSIGRYTQVDPIGLNGGINPYVYVDNNPVNAIDSSGFAPGLSGSIDEGITKAIHNPIAVPDGYLGLMMHGHINKFNDNGYYSLDKNSEIYNMLNKDYASTLDFGYDGKLGLSGRKLADLILNHLNINYSQYKGLYLYICNGGSSINSDTGVANAQEVANKMNMNVFAPTAYINVKFGNDSNLIESYSNYYALSWLYDHNIFQYGAIPSFRAEDVMKKFIPRN